LIRTINLGKNNFNST